MDTKDIEIKVKSVGKLGETVSIVMTHVPTQKLVAAVVPAKDHAKTIKYLYEKLDRMIGGHRNLNPERERFS